LFFRRKSPQFAPAKEDLQQYNDENFAKACKLGEIKFADSDRLMVCSFAAQNPLTERSGKKAQYDKAKKILREQQIYSAGIFIFYDANGNFRFSLVYPEYTGSKRQWSNFRRFTYFVSSDPAITNKTFKQRVGDGDFSTLAKIKEAFSVEKVTSEFYEAIANWYFWAEQHCRFPKDAEAEENGHKISVIRLITRMIFIWFMRERGLVPKALFDQRKMQEILKGNAPEATTYYKAVLQNLFFATLSTRKEERQFRSEIRGHKGYNPDFGNQYVYRYHDLFKNPNDIRIYFDDIPFLNGGLFECLDDKPNGIYIDGFTSVKKNQPEIPNYLFFSDEQNVDLNPVYGTANKKYNVRGLLNILSSFSFTIDENSMDDQEVALDPELLGRVFENLLASFNPETETTARKATGSYYTPRGIVDYMVTESLKAYFKTHLSSAGHPNHPSDCHQDRDEESLVAKIDKLFSTSEETNPFDLAETQQIVDLIESVKIVDPAVGSGAYPMGALHKMVFILNKLDPGNELWKQAQLKVADAITDPTLRRETKEKISEFFQGKNADYGRKLYLIQRCIYGVDIQQIAVEIAKLRIFISLLVDEKIDRGKDNWGVEPLPNLDFKIMQGNSLISNLNGIDFDVDAAGNGKKTQTGFDFVLSDGGLIRDFEQKKIDFQNEPDTQKKKVLKEEIEDLLIKIFEKLVKKQKADYFNALEDIKRRNAVMPNAQKRAEMIANEKQKLVRNTGFDLEAFEKQLREFTSKKKTKPFFPWRFYFAEVFEKGGFDITIGNPPYVRQESIKNLKASLKEAFPDFYSGTADLYTYFYKRGIELLRNYGHLCFIAPNKFMRASYGKNTRRLLAKEVTPRQIIDFGDIPIFDATTYPSIVLIQKTPLPLMGEGRVEAEALTATFTDITQIEDPAQTLKDIGFKISINALKEAGWTLERADVLVLMDKLRRTGKPLSEYVQGRFYRGILTGLNEAFVVDEATRRKLIAEDPKSSELIKPWLRGRDIKKWKAECAGIYVIFTRRRIDIGNYPAIKRHLLQFKKDLEPKKFENDKHGRKPGTYEWFEIQDNIAYYKEFDKTKIIWGNLATEPKFAFDDAFNYISAPANILPTNDLSLLAILNSPICKWWIGHRAATRSGGFLEYKPMYVGEIPIPLAEGKEKIMIIERVQKILAAPDGPNVSKLEDEINEMVYKLYDLTFEEIKIVEDTLDKGKEKT
jgi:hypothetical protein